jgi:proteasome activator subunit 4
MTSLLECQHEEKPSIQKLVASIASDCVSHLSEESVHTYAFTHDAPGVRQALQDLAKEFSPTMVDQQLLKISLDKSKFGAVRREKRNAETVSRF